MPDSNLLEHEGCELSAWVAFFFHGGSTSCPLFILEIVHVAHVITVKLREMRTGDLLTCTCVQCLQIKQLMDKSTSVCV